MAQQELAIVGPETAVAKPVATSAPSDLRHFSMTMPVEQQQQALAEFKERRDNFRDWLRAQLVEGIHYGYPPGCEPRFDDNGNVLVWMKGGYKPFPKEQWTPKPSFYLAGADFVCDLLGLKPEYAADKAAWEQMGSPVNTFVFACYLRSRSTGEIVGEGRGVRQVGQKGGDANNAIKMAMKCLGGETPVLIKTPRGIVRTTVHNAYSHDSHRDGSMEIAGPSLTWRKVMSITKMPQMPSLAVTFQNGSRVVCSRDHKWPVECGGLKETSDLTTDDVVPWSRLPFGSGNAPDWLGWLVGIYLAEGSLDVDLHCVRFHLHADEERESELIKEYCGRLGCSVMRAAVTGSRAQVVSANGHSVMGVLRHFVNGDGSARKRLSVNAWRQNHAFLNSVLQGYLDGDGCRVTRRGRHPYWSLNFTGKNGPLRADLKALAAIAGVRCKIRESSRVAFGKVYSTSVGWIKEQEPSYNGRALGRVVSVDNAGLRVLYNIEVDGDHLFCLADGLVTHNSAKVAAVLDTYGLRDAFTQDLEDSARVAADHDNPEHNENAPKVQPRSQRMDAKTIGHEAARWKALQHPDDATPEGWAKWVLKTTNCNFDPTKASQWTTSHLMLVRQALDREEGK